MKDEAVLEFQSYKCKFLSGKKLPGMMPIYYLYFVIMKVLYQLYIYLKYDNHLNIDGGIYMLLGAFF